MVGDDGAGGANDQQPRGFLDDQGAPPTDRVEFFVSYSVSRVYSGHRDNHGRVWCVRMCTNVPCSEHPGLKGDVHFSIQYPTTQIVSCAVQITYSIRDSEDWDKVLVEKKCSGNFVNRCSLMGVGCFSKEECESAFNESDRGRMKISIEMKEMVVDCRDAPEHKEMMQQSADRTFAIRFPSADVFYVNPAIFGAWSPLIATRMSEAISRGENEIILDEDSNFCQRFGEILVGTTPGKRLLLPLDGNSDLNYLKLEKYIEIATRLHMQPVLDDLDRLLSLFVEVSVGESARLLILSEKHTLKWTKIACLKHISVKTIRQVKDSPQYASLLPETKLAIANCRLLANTNNDSSDSDSEYDF
ncbi:hypothetical protein PFISCL1PPCAC_21407 [Pristionchus fissidentatus]|uniref:BTB domain-containing protein n=1 Tax=Pristionchus fissidentatus TaxID=1538716 RepID=A0AAV5WEL8_9BILA|nr:hypothetical protein PFISCL1PPCAC_21407 [Pristionchus fissidentatus]